MTSLAFPWSERKSWSVRATWGCHEHRWSAGRYCTMTVAVTVTRGRPANNPGDWGQGTRGQAVSKPHKLYERGWYCIRRRHRHGADVDLTEGTTRTIVHVSHLFRKTALLKLELGTHGPLMKCILRGNKVNRTKYA